MSRFVLTLLRYVWALPNTALGLTFAPLAWLGRGGVRFVDGVIEIEGGGVRWLLRNATPIGGAMALTLGHVVLGQSRAALSQPGFHGAELFERYMGQVVNAHQNRYSACRIASACSPSPYSIRRCPWISNRRVRSRASVKAWA